jgi:hypothetical protein
LLEVFDISFHKSEWIICFAVMLFIWLVQDRYLLIVIPKYFATSVDLVADHLNYKGILLDVSCSSHYSGLNSMDQTDSLSFQNCRDLFGGFVTFTVHLGLIWLLDTCIVWFY